MKRALLLSAVLLATPFVIAAGPDLSQGGPVTITAEDGMDWQQNEQIVVARGNAHAVRGDTTVIADQLTAHYRKKASSAAASAPSVVSAPGGGKGNAGQDDLTGDSEIYQLDADGHVTINTPTDIISGDKAVYNMDRAVLVMTGRHLNLKTPTEVVTARDQMEYWSNEHRSVARGDALLVTNDGRSVRADILVAYSDATPTAAKPAAKPGGSGVDTGQLRRVDAFGHVVVRTQADIVRGDNGVYLPQTGIARVVGNVTITHGLSEIHGQDAIIDLKTGIAHLTPGKGGPVQGLLVPNDHSVDHNPSAGSGKTTHGNAGQGSHQ